MFVCVYVCLCVFVYSEGGSKVCFLEGLVRRV